MSAGPKRCPFCNGKVAIARMSDGDEHWFYIHGIYNSEAYCHCRVFMESEKFRDNATKAEILNVRRDLINKWNRRA